MASYNRVILMGNLTRDPELRYIPSGTAVVEIGMAVNERRKGPNGDWIDEVHFFDVTLWGRTAEVVSEYCTKGSPLFVEGRLKQDRWEKDGQKHSKIKITADRIQLLGARNGGGPAPHVPDDEPQYSSAGSGGGGRSAPPPPPDSDLPF
jgi:single-strand DNA-binding protein